MSYGVSLFFKTCMKENVLDEIATLQKEVGLYTESDTFYSDLLLNTGKQRVHDEFISYVKSLFKITVIYYEEFNSLAIIPTYFMQNLPFIKELGYHEVYFQSSTDQNYTEKQWTYPLFQKLYKTCMLDDTFEYVHKSHSENAKNRLKHYLSDSDWDMSDKESLDYMKQTIFYAYIEELFDVELCLYNTKTYPHFKTHIYLFEQEEDLMVCFMSLNKRLADLDMPEMEWY